MIQYENFTNLRNNRYTYAHTSILSLDNIESNLRNKRYT